jgi:hypothetical protein
MKVTGHLHAPAALTLGKEPPVLNVQETGWAPVLGWMLCKREKSLVPAGNQISIPWLSRLQPIAILTKLSQFFVSDFRLFN